MPRQNSALAVAFSAFAVGVVIAFLATIQVVQSDRAQQQATGFIQGGPVPVDPDTGDPVDPDTGEVIDPATGAVVDPSTGEVVDPSTGEVIDPSTGQTGPGGADPSGNVDVGGGGPNGGNGGDGGGDLACAAGKNGGNTDTGVTADQILLGATVVEDGFAAEFLGEVKQGMLAVLNRVNRQGGLCGRQLKLEARDDGWDPSKGKKTIEDLISDTKVFALAVSPSSEGVNAASNGDVFRDTGVPVVGADGLAKSQFNDPYIFPVAAATVTSVDVMMEHAYEEGTRHPAVVFGNGYRFGIEGANAANDAFRKLTEANEGEPRDIPGFKKNSTSCDQRFCGVSPGTGQYGNPISLVESACESGDECDFMIYLLEPQTAQQWMNQGGPQPKDFDYGISAPQPLFTRKFGVDCGDRCADMRLWTGYNPPIEQYANQDPVARFTQELQAQSGSADVNNQFTLGGYVGMEVMVKALEAVGPNLTRDRLIDTLNSMAPIDTGLTVTPLQWRPQSGSETKNRHANRGVQAFDILSQNGFRGWRFVQGSIQEDRWLGQHGG